MGESLQVWRDRARKQLLVAMLEAGLLTLEPTDLWGGGFFMGEEGRTFSSLSSHPFAPAVTTGYCQVSAGGQNRPR